jgi:hypothetical protein
MVHNLRSKYPKSFCAFLIVQMWENIRGHEIAEVNQSAYALIVGTGAISLVAALLEFEG